jgi:hypothetical protein
MHIRKDVAEGAAVAAAAVAVAVAAVISTGLIIWRDRATGPAWHAVTAGLLFALMIAWSGHDSVLIGLAVVLIAVMLARAVTGHLRPAHARPRSLLLSWAS